jgi:hypothetical protein
MALEQEIDGSGEAQSGKDTKQNQVHSSAASGTGAGLRTPACLKKID